MPRGRPVEIPVRRAQLAVLLQMAIDDARTAGHGGYTRQMIRTYGPTLGPYRADVRRYISYGLHAPAGERRFEGAERDAWLRLHRDLGGDQRRRR